MKVAFVVCYNQADYIRATSLRVALSAMADVNVIDIRNRRLGFARYIEVPIKLLQCRWRNKPDAYLLTFRGYEMLLFLVMTIVRKPIIFDEFVNFTEWMEENSKLKPGSLKYRLFRNWYSWLSKHCRFILADTMAHANHSAQINRLPINLYRAIPVGANEKIFFPKQVSKPTNNFTVFYYGSMRPLHGLSYLLEAAEMLKHHSEINFLIVGGNAKVKEACHQANQTGAKLTYKNWLPLKELPDTALEAGLTIGGPLGGTTQSKYVITGKTYQFLALGAPVLIGQNEVNGVFQNKKNCLVVRQADAEALAESIVWASRHPSELEVIGREGRLLYKSHFSQAVINDLVANVFHSL